MALIIGTAGWSIPSKDAAAFIEQGTSLERYASRFRGVEVNSSFYRPHRVTTWARWASSVPADFRFSVKMPKTITHQHKLVDCADLLAQFFDEVSGLGEKLGVLLVQLPPKLAFESSVVADFFALLASHTSVRPVCEPRHASWFADDAEHLLEKLHVARVAADPALTPSGSLPGGWRGLSYWRLHGSPVMYRSSYADRLAHYAKLISDGQEVSEDTWCMFDNTASSAATSDALALMADLNG